MSKIGIDISSWQYRINYSEAVKHIDFAILRIGYGVSYLPEKQRDDQFDNHYAGFYGKVPVGGYYYQYAKNVDGAKKEADNCLKYLGDKYLDLPIFYDIEDNSIANIDKNTLTDMAIAFCEIIKNAGHQAGIYCNKYFAINKLDMNRLQDYSIWIASYGTNNGQPQENAKYTGKQDYWQYTSRGYIEGINGNVDMNIAYVDADVPSKEEVKTEVEESKPIYTGNSQIREIQKWLNSNYNSGLAEDGYYGPKTKQALIKAYQHELNVQFKKGLDEDGIWGPKTKNASIIVKQGAKGNITKLIQSMLYFKGYDTNGIDGIFGEGTTKAVKRFQGNQGLSVDGIVGKNTFEKLFL